jgi:hypothetical protein
MNKRAIKLHESNEKKQRIRAGVMTVVIFSGVLLLCFFLIAFTIPDPPPGDQYVAVEFADLGSVTDAEGITESEVPSEIVEEVMEESISVPTIKDPVASEEIVTQETSEISIPEKDEEVEEKPLEEPEPIRVSAAANLIRSNAASGGGGSQGSSEGIGNQGDEDGKIDGSGVVSGDFGNASLNGGSLVNAPRLKEKPKKKGVIRMNIIVDSSGKVISARFDGGLDSDISDDEHIRLATEAAMSATFTSNMSLPRRSGFITIRFELE